MVAVDEEQPIPGLAGLAPSPTKQHTAKVKQSKQPAPTTDTGDSVAEILGSWVAWYQCGSGVPIPQSVRARLGKQVKQLIVTGYQTDEIKHGLAIWTVEQMDNPTLSPTLLDNFVWKYTRDTRAGAREWQEAVRRRVAEFSSVANKARGKSEARRANNIQVLQDWKDKT